MRSAAALGVALMVSVVASCASVDERADALGTIPSVSALPEPWVQPAVSAENIPWYSPGRCEHAGQSIYVVTLADANDDFAVAVECSRRRCDSGDAVGCRDAATLYLDPARGGERRPAEGLRYAQRGCNAGDGSACALLAFEAIQGDGVPVGDMSEKACRADAKNLVLCGFAGRRLVERGATARGIRLFLRACRGTLTAPIDGRGIDYVRQDPLLLDPGSEGPELHRYDGCRELASLAASAGDAQKAYDYARLHCLHGAGGTETCLEIAELAIARHGAEDLRTQRILQRGCETFDLTEPQRALCQKLR